MIKLEDIITTTNPENQEMLNKIIELGNKKIEETYELVNKKDKKTLQSLFDGSYDGMLQAIYRKDDLLKNPNLIPYLKKLDDSVGCKIWRDIVNEEIVDSVEFDFEEE